LIGICERFEKGLAKDHGEALIFYPIFMKTICIITIVLCIFYNAEYIIIISKKLAAREILFWDGFIDIDLTAVGDGYLPLAGGLIVYLVANFTAYRFAWKSKLSQYRKKDISLFSLMVNNIPKDFIEEDIKRMFLNNRVDILYCTLIYNCSDYTKHLKELKLKENIFRLRKNVIKKLKNAKSQEDLFESLIVAEENLNKKKKRISHFEQKAFSGKAIILFNSLEEKQSVFRNFRFPLNPIKWFRYAMDSGKNGNCWYVSKCTSPSDIIWENIGYSNFKRNIRRFINFVFLRVIIITMISVLLLLVNITTVIERFNSSSLWRWMLKFLLNQKIMRQFIH